MGKWLDNLQFAIAPRIFFSLGVLLEPIELLIWHFTPYDRI